MGSSELAFAQFTSVSARLSSPTFTRMMKLFVALMVLVAVAQASDFECHGVGAFPDTDCTGFHVCETDGAGFLESWYPCPTGLLYDVDHKKCTAEGNCPTAVNKPLEI